VVVPGKLTTEWIILKTILGLVILRGVFQASLKDYARFKIALNQLIVQLWGRILRQV
jgi:hypothetical protein